MAIVIANDKVKTSCSRFGFNPFAYANSSFNVVIRSAVQRQPINTKIRATPPQIIARSSLETAKISPKRYAIKSKRTPESSDTITKPTASAECAKTPNSVSVA